MRELRVPSAAQALAVKDPSTVDWLQSAEVRQPGAAGRGWGSELVGAQRQTRQPADNGASLGTCVLSLGLGFLNCEMGVMALPCPISKGQ